MPARRRVHPRELLDGIERCSSRAGRFEIWRVCWKTRDVLEGGPSGRWHPAGTSSALYSSLTPDGAIAEIYHHLSQAPIRSSAEKLLHRLEVQTEKTLDLTVPGALEQFSLADEIALLDGMTRSQEIGAAAQMLGYDSLLVPSLRWSCNNLVLFLDDLQSTPVPRESDAINWPAWREANAVELEAIRSRQRAARKAKAV